MIKNDITKYASKSTLDIVDRGTSFGVHTHFHAG